MDMVDKISNMQLDDLNSKPHRAKSPRYIIDPEIGLRFYPPPGSEHHKIIYLNSLHGPTHRQVNSHDKPDKKIKCTLHVTCKKYNVIHHDRAEKYTQGTILHI